MKNTFIIAEIGVNHNGSIELAKKLIDAANCADAVKFQTYKTDNLLTKFAPKAVYQNKLTDKKESQYQMLKKFELDKKTHKELINYCRKKRLIFISTPCDLYSIDLLDNLGLEIFKIPSSDITNLPYLEKIGSLKKKIILSTGMSNLGEIKKALDILIKAGTPKKNITVLHCNTEYPTPYEDVNLFAMLTIKEALKVEVGYSDHTLGIEIPIAAVAMGASVIEKHFTLDKKMDGPDHKFSLEPHEFKEMVQAIRNTEKSLGDGIKKSSPSELKNKPIVRKSIVALKDIKKGQRFTEENITVKRPGTGINPMEWKKIIRKEAKRNFKSNELIEI